MVGSCPPLPHSVSRSCGGSLPSHQRMGVPAKDPCESCPGRYKAPNQVQAAPSKRKLLAVLPAVTPCMRQWQLRSALPIDLSCNSIISDGTIFSGNSTAARIRAIQLITSHVGSCVAQLLPSLSASRRLRDGGTMARNSTSARCETSSHVGCRKRELCTSLPCLLHNSGITARPEVGVSRQEQGGQRAGGSGDRVETPR